MVDILQSLIFICDFDTDNTYLLDSGLDKASCSKSVLWGEEFFSHICFPLSPRFVGVPEFSVCFVFVHVLNS